MDIVLGTEVNLAALLTALHFAADKHRDQRRKNREASPYINHPIEVVEILGRVGGVTDLPTLQAAILHDTIEDTQTTGEDLEGRFGTEVRQLVEEVSDDQRLPKAQRKRLQIEHAPHLSPKAKLIKIADKISNVRDVTHSPPAHWPHRRRCEYLDWAEKVVAGLRGSNPAVDAMFDDTLKEGRRLLTSGSDNLPASSDLR
ncbi:MAG TPA: HD domain-containing protein [Terriglobia bacterium]|nr:HD domain-containing protein [Terriglobia bacterium]